MTLSDLQGNWFDSENELDLLLRNKSPYIYIYVIDNIPRYVGKGSGRRWRAHRDTKSHLGNCLRKRRAEIGYWLLPIACKVDSDEMAMYEEVRLIAGFGRLDLNKGTLWNLTDGGEGTRGVIISAARWEKIMANARDPVINQQRAIAMVSNWKDPIYRTKTQAAQRKNDHEFMLEKINAGVPLKLIAIELNIPYPTLVAFRTKELGSRRHTKFRPPKTNVGVAAWIVADKIFENIKFKPAELSRLFNLDPIALNYLLIKIKRGWNPLDDPEWAQWKMRVLNKVC